MIYTLTTIGYILYIEFSPSMGNIWIRSGHFVPSNIIRLMFQPFHDIKMWTFTSMWPINYIIWLGIATAFKYLDLLCFYQISDVV